MGIINYAQVIDERLDLSQKQLNKFSSAIIYETKRVAEIVHNLLTFARDTLNPEYDPDKIMT